MEKISIDIESIQNKDEFERVKENAICSICQGLVYQPKQCQVCENSFCKMCIDEWLKKKNNCPFRCKNPRFRESRVIKNLLEKLKIKCPFGCDDIIQYGDLDSHKGTCINTSYKQKCTDYEKKIKELENKNKELEIKIKSLENQNNSNSNNNYSSKLKRWQKMSNLHNHPLIFCTTKRADSWFCDNCKKFFDNSHYSYLCTLCDFDLCENCFK